MTKEELAELVSERDELRLRMDAYRAGMASANAKVLRLTRAQEALQQELAEAAHELPCAGSIAHRIRVLKREFADHLAKLAPESSPRKTIIHEEWAGNVARQIHLLFDLESASLLQNPYGSSKQIAAIILERLPELEGEAASSPQGKK